MLQLFSWRRTFKIKNIFVSSGNILKRCNARVTQKQYVPIAVIFQPREETRLTHGGTRRYLSLRPLRLEVEKVKNCWLNKCIVAELSNIIIQCFIVEVVLGHFSLSKFNFIVTVGCVLIAMVHFYSSNAHPDLVGMEQLPHSNSSTTMNLIIQFLLFIIYYLLDDLSKISIFSSQKAQGKVYTLLQRKLALRESNLSRVPHMKLGFEPRSDRKSLLALPSTVFGALMLL